jgi:hypothetical protein
MAAISSYGVYFGRQSYRPTLSHGMIVCYCALELDIELTVTVNE